MPSRRTRQTLALTLALGATATCGPTRGGLYTAGAAPTVSGRESLERRAPPAVGSRYAAPDERVSREQLLASLPTGAARLTPDEILARHPVQFGAPVAANPDALEGMRVIQQGRFALQPNELERLRAQGFALSSQRTFPNFMTGYAMLYIADQPVYMSADAVLNALHLSFDTMVAEIEADALLPAITQSIRELRTSLAGERGAALSAETRRDLDTYLAVTLGLLQGSAVEPVGGGSSADIEAFRAQATTARGVGRIELFGAMREVDFSQFTPRGHYAGVPERERYFRAVMWLGREGLRLVDTVNGQRVLQRRGVAAALALDALSTPAARSGLRTMNEVVAGFAGEPEALGVEDFAELSREVTRGGGIARISDGDLLAAIDRIRGDRPRVATTLLHHPDGATRSSPEPVALSLSAQRYSPDSMVLSRVSFDRVAAGAVRRMMPEALDAAFGAMGNDQALALLAPSLRRHDYASELETARVLVDAHERAYWENSMYSGWLAALRELSPRATLADPAGMPAVMTTEAWGRRLLNTQMAAWSEMRHDMVLYLAQSYSAVPGCSYPAAYVDPYPAFWDALGRWVTRGRALIAQVPWRTAATRARWERWVNHAGTVVTRLGEMARRERAGQDLTADQLAYMNQAVNAREQNVVCTTVTTVDAGWYYELFEPRLDLGDTRSMVADVHTQPADENGDPVGHVLHIGTGMPRTMVVVAGPADRPRAYIGVASTYLERTTSNFERLDDARWRREIERAHAPEWLTPVLAR